MPSGRAVLELQQDFAAAFSYQGITRKGLASAASARWHSPWHSSCAGHKNEPSPCWWATQAYYLLQLGSHRLHTVPEPADTILVVLWGKVKNGSGFLSPQLASLSHAAPVRFAGRGVRCLGCCSRCSSGKKCTALTLSCDSCTRATSPSKDTNNLDGLVFKQVLKKLCWKGQWNKRNRMSN